MNKKILFHSILLGSLFFGPEAFSKEKLAYDISDCGSYKAQGLAEKISDEFFLTFFKGSKSEIRLQISEPSSMKLLPYLDKEVVVTIEIDSLPEYQKGKARILTIADLITSAIHVEDRQGFALTKKMKCSSKLK